MPEDRPDAKFVLAMCIFTFLVIAPIVLVIGGAMTPNYAIFIHKFLWVCASLAVVMLVLLFMST